MGVVFSERSPRHASEGEALEVIAAARAVSPAIDTVLVVRELDAEQAASAALRLGFDVLQLHGAYTAVDFDHARVIMPRVWRASSLAKSPRLQAGEYREERLLVDGAAAGSGEAWDLGLIKNAELGTDWILAGGLSPENVAAAIREACPAGVDVSSGVESAPGIKDLERIESFIAAARS